MMKRGEAIGISAPDMSFATRVPQSFFVRAQEILAAHRPTTPEALSVEAMGRVLTVEKRKEWRDRYHRLGTEAGHEVIGVATANEAISKIKGGTFDLVITTRQGGFWPLIRRYARDRGVKQIVLISGESLPGVFGRNTENDKDDTTKLSKTGDIEAELTKIFDSLNRKPAIAELESGAKRDERETTAGDEREDDAAFVNPSSVPLPLIEKFR